MNGFGVRPTTSAYDENYAYDPNGNITTLQRNNELATLKDDFAYSYYDTTNRLKQHKVSGGLYTYDAIGNLTNDGNEGVTISWTPYGKVRTVHKGDSVTVSYRYDAAGNRVEKKVVKDSLATITQYLRDASGNVMAIYRDTTATEVPIYGSARLGEYKGGTTEGYRTLGLRNFELSNHLGNVLAVITDNAGMKADSVWAKVVSASDYYPFGLEMNGRTWSDTTSTYRYGFNGKEKDSAFASTMDYDYGFRIYDPRIARFFSPDPLLREYPELSPYQFAGNSPIWATDLDGAEPLRKTNEQPKVEPQLKLGDVGTVLEYGRKVEHAIHYTINSLDLHGVDMSDPNEYERVYRTVKNNTVIVPTKETTYVLPKNEETMKFSQAVKEYGPDVLDKTNTVLEGYSKFKPGMISSKVLKSFNVANKIVSPIEFLKVNPVIAVLIEAGKPSDFGIYDSKENFAEAKVKSALYKLFTPPQQAQPFDFGKPKTIESDATDIKKREGSSSTSESAETNSNGTSNTRGF